MRLSKRTFSCAWVLLLLLLSLTLTVSRIGAAPARQQAEPVVLYFFWGDGCPYCEYQKPFLEELESRYPNLEVRAYEVYSVEENRTLFIQMADAQGFQARAVPTTILGEHYWMGFSDDIAQAIEAHVEACSIAGCPDAGVGLVPSSGEPVPTPTATPTPMPSPTPVPVTPAPMEQEPGLGERPADGASADLLRIPLLGTVDLGAQSVVVSTAIIAFVDGFNPCSLWVLSILISLTLRTGSRKKVFLVGFVFLSVTSLVYGFFIAGMFTMFTFISFVGWIQGLVALIALLFAVVNIKDYFWYKEGVSLTISDEKKPGLYKRMRKIMNADSLWGMLVATVAMSAGVSIIEFSCTAGFPLLWTNLLVSQGVGRLTFVLLLGLYMLIYLLDELAIFLIAVFTLRASKLQEKHGRILKLIGGTLMLTLAAVMLVDPALMNEISSTLVIFSIAFVAALLVLVLHRTVLPRFGVFVGTELDPSRD